MRHPDDGVLRRLVDEPAGVPDADRTHVVACDACLDRFAAVRADADERVRRMPVVVLSHSEVEADVHRSYDLGANSHIAKPHSLDALFEIVETLGRYWLSVVSLPN
jgi:DNA-binding NarL/FixJ family response regulator